MSTAEQWPPAPTLAAPWHEQRLPLRGEGRQLFRVREVRLWGKNVLIDEDHAVYCRCCQGFVDVAELGKVTNSHLVGLPFRAEGMLLPIGFDGDDDDREVHRARPHPATVMGF